MDSAARMHPRDLERLAELVADRLAARLTETTQTVRHELVDAAAIARLTGLSRDTIYARAVELGGIRVGSGPRPRLRFDPGRVLRRLEGDGPRSVLAQKPTPNAARRAGSDAELLPIRGTRA